VSYEVPQHEPGPGDESPPAGPATAPAPGASAGSSQAALDLARENPLREMIRLAIPTVATMASYTTMQFCDALMVSRIDPPSPVYLAAQGNGGVWAFVPMSLMAGLTGVVNTYVAQNLGAGKAQRGAAYVWNALWLSLLTWALALIPLALAMPWIFASMAADPASSGSGAGGHSPELVRLETAYAQILLFGGVFSMASRAVSQYFYGMHKPGVTLVAALAGNIVNLFLNWVLIFGNLGAPALGVSGAAYATVIGTMVELAIPLCVFLGPSFNRRFATRSAWRWSSAHVRDIVRIGWPPALMFANEMVCWAVFMSHLAGRFGTEHNTAGWIALRYMHLSFMPAVGLGFACTAAVGKCLGAGRPDLAKQRARIGIGLAMAYMGVCAALFVVLREPMIRLFLSERMAQDPALAAQGEAVVAVGMQIMIVAAVFQVFDGLGITLIGVLRGAGDTVWPGVVTIILAWTFIIGLGSALAYGLPQWGSLGPWLAAGAYIIALGLALAWRFRSGVWQRTKLLDHSASAGH
jgi:MATE family multidrug resistance protein